MTRETTNTEQLMKRVLELEAALEAVTERFDDLLTIMSGEIKELEKAVRAMKEEVGDVVDDINDGPRLSAAYEEWKRDPSTARPWEEFEAELKADGLLDDEDNETSV